MNKNLVAFLRSLLNRMKPSGKPILRGSKSSEFAKRTAEKITARETAALSKDVAKNSHKRKDARTTLTVIAELAFPDRGFSLDGVILEASRGGLTFRPASHYIEEKAGEQIQVRVEETAKKGIIRSTRVNGYGIQLFDPFSEAELESFRTNSIDLKPFDEAAA
ncbi:MAG: hypothetical protein AAF224_00370 [Pseudomonadota bacterium]